MRKNKGILSAIVVAFIASFGFAVTSMNANVQTASAEGSSFKMLGGAIRLNEETPGIRFQANISDDEYQAITNPESEKYDETAVFGMMIAPLDYMEGIEAGDDYIVELSQKSLSVSPIIHYSLPYQKEVEEGEEVDTSWYVNGSISNVLYQNSNREFFGIAFMRTGVEGSYEYTYPEIESIESMSRTVSEIAIKARNDEKRTYTDDEYKIIDGYIAKGINLANGAEQTAEPTVTVSMPSAHSAYLIGETFELSASYAPNALDLTVLYQSSDPEVAKITGNTVEILKAGDAVITATVKNYGTEEKPLLTIETASMSIMAGSLAMDAPNYMAVGTTDTFGVTFGDYTVPEVEFVSDNGAIEFANGTATPKKSGTTTVTANISFEGVSTSISKQVTVVDFGSVSGEMVDLATNVDMWNYRNFNDAEGVTLTYTASKVADNRPIANYGLHYYRPDNTGTSSGATGKLLYLHPEIVDLAKAQGYQYLSYYIFVPKMSGVDTSCSSVAYVVNADGSLYYKKSNSISFNWLTTTTSWTLSRIKLSDIDDGQGVGFIGYGQNIYLTNVYLTGTDGTANKNALLNQSTINSQVKTVDLAKEELLGKMFVTDMSNATLSIEKGADTARNLDAVVIKRDAGSYTYSNSNRRNGLIISSEWIQAAKAKGCTCIVFRYYNANGAFTVYKVTDLDTASWSKWTDPTKGQWGFYGISLENFKPGDRILFAFAGDTFKLSNIELRTTYYSSSLVPTA